MITTIRPLALGCLLIFLPLVAPAELDGEVPTYKFNYNKTASVPDNVFVRHFLELIASGITDDHGRYHAIIDIKQRLYVDSDDRAEDILDLLLAQNSQLHAARKADVRKLICPFNTVRPTGNDVYLALDAVDGNQDKAGDLALRQLNARLGDDLYGYLMDWMTEVKLQSRLLRLDHQAIHIGENPDIVRQRICSKVGD